MKGGIIICNLSTLEQIKHRYTPYNLEVVNCMLNQQFKGFDKKIVVIDDDPTGIQTVHDVSVYTDWSTSSIKKGFEEKTNMFFILTNSRSFSAEKTEKVHRDIGEKLAAVSKETGKQFIVISRGDSTLRGHYPLETESIRLAIEQESKIHFDGEIIVPFFKEGGRFTIEDIHYILQNDTLIPVGETEFAEDKTFGYKSSNLAQWIEEKSRGAYLASEVVKISLKSLRNRNYEEIRKQLNMTKNFDKVIVNALDYEDLKVFVTALLMALEDGKNYIFRSAASFVKVIGGVPDRPLLSRDDLITERVSSGGLVVVGSHVNKTTEQLKQLEGVEDVTMIEFNQHLAINPPLLDQEVERAIAACESIIRSGQTAVVYTRRERFDLNINDKEAELKMAVRISEALTKIVANIKVRPSFIIAKGGITSSDIGIKGLGVRRATVAGQIRPGIPVWFTGEESRFPEIPYVIFPGNVGKPEDLRCVVEVLMRGEMRCS